MKIAAGLAILACGFAAVWMSLWRAPADPLPLCAGLAAGSLLAGWLVDRWRPKPVLVAGLLLLGAASRCLAAIPRFDAWPRLWMGALGLGAGMTLVAANALVPAAARGGRAATLNLLNLLLPVGAVFSAAFGPDPVARLATLVCAVAALGGALWTRAPAPPESAAAETRPAIPLVALLLFLYAACEAAIWSRLVAYMSAVKVLAPETSWQILCYGLPLGLIAGRVWSARLLANVAPPRVLRFASLAMTFSTPLLLLARSPSASWIAGFLVGVAMAPVLPTTLAMASDALSRRPATGMGIALAAGALGLAASGPLIAWIASRSSLPTAMLILPVLSLGMGQVTIAMRPAAANPRQRAD